MGGGGGKTGEPGNFETPKESKELFGIGKGLLKETGPLRNTFVDQLLEALTTGGIEARIPIIQRATESAKASLSDSMSGLRDSLARSGLSSSPFGKATVAKAYNEGQLGVSQIAPNIIQHMIDMIPGYVTGMAGTAMQGMGKATEGAIAAMQANAAVQNANTGAKTDFMTAPFKMFQFSF